MLWKAYICLMIFYSSLRVWAEKQTAFPGACALWSYLWFRTNCSALIFWPRLRPLHLIRPCKSCLSVTLPDIWAVTWLPLTVGKYELTGCLWLALVQQLGVGRRSLQRGGPDWCNLLQLLCAASWPAWKCKMTCSMPNTGVMLQQCYRSGFVILWLYFKQIHHWIWSQAEK